MYNKKQLKILKAEGIEVLQPAKIVSIPSSAIHIENNISLVQKKLWFELVYCAFPNLGKQRKHTIKLDRLRELLGWNDTTSNDKELKEALRGLNKTTVSWNIFGKDKKHVWESFSLLAGCQIPKDSGICIYDFSIFLEERFAAMGEEAYVKIDLIISKKFQSKYALSMYCLALDYLMMENGYSEKKFTIEELRRYFAVKPDEYKLTGDFQKRVINMAEEEINKISDINIEIKPYKEGRKIAGYKLCMSLKPGRAKDYLEKKERFKQLSQKNEVTKSEIIENQVLENPKPKLLVEIDIENQVLKQFLLENSISLTTVTIQNRLLKLKIDTNDNLEDYLLFLMNYAKKEFKKGNIKSLSGFFASLLKDNTQIDNYLFYQEQKKQSEIEKDKVITRHINLELQEMYEHYLSNDFQDFISDNLDKLATKITKYVDENIQPNTFVYDAIIKRKMNGEFSMQEYINLPKSHQVPFINEFKKNQSYFGYKTMTYAEWQSEYTDQDLIKSIREKLLNDKRL
ncbi:MAG: replication initiation protein [Candidatus Sericytochromatia bacterium]|nr:replication initiation protein [Candidatus Sericytochromatia bacterium]